MNTLNDIGIMFELKLEFGVDYQKYVSMFRGIVFVVVASSLYFNFASFNADCVKKHNSKHSLMQIITNDI